MKVYITFGQVHTHSVNGKTLDKDSVAIIEADSIGDGREKAMEMFDGVFHRALGKAPDMSYFPRGFIAIP